MLDKGSYVRPLSHAFRVGCFGNISSAIVIYLAQFSILILTVEDTTVEPFLDDRLLAAESTSVIFLKSHC